MTHVSNNLVTAQSASQQSNSEMSLLHCEVAAKKKTKQPITHI